MPRSGYLLLIALVLLSACARKDAGPKVVAAEPPPVQAKVWKVEARAFTSSVAVTGTLVSKTRVDVKAETTGRVTRFDKEEGEHVRAGEEIIWVDSENSRLAVSQAESAVAVAEAGLEKARILEAHNRSEHERARNLLASGGITDRDLKAAAVAEKDAVAQVGLAQAQLAQATAALEVARKHLRDNTIHAPVSGEIQRKFINPGAYVEPATTVFSLVDNSKLELESPVASADLAPIRAGQRVTFQVNSYPGESFAGAVVEINPAVDTDSRSARIRVGVPNPGGRLRAGMFAQGEILTGVSSQAIVIPGSAAYREDRTAKQSSVFVVEGGKAVRRAVRIGRERDGQLEILEGLKPGDLLVTEQSIELAEGVRVEGQ